MKRLPCLVLVFALGSLLAASSARASQVSALRQLLNTKADRYPGPGRSHCHVESISPKAISFTTIAGGRDSNHTEHIALFWENVSSITFAKNTTHPRFTTLRLGLRQAVPIQMSTTMEGHTQSQNGMDDKVDFDFASHKDAERCRDLVHEIVSALHKQTPVHRQWHRGGTR